MANVTLTEREIVERFASRLPGEAQARLLDDLNYATVSQRYDDDSRVEFELRGYQRPAYRGQHALPIEARMVDKDGADITVLLHVDANGRLLELEFIKWGGGRYQGANLDTLTFPGS